MGCRAVVTGAHGGFGQAVTAALAQRGTAVHAIDVHPDTESWAYRLATNHDWKVTGHRCDLADPDATERVLPDLLGVGAIHVLVNALGVFGRGRLGKQDRAAWDGVIAAILNAAVAATAACLPGLLAADWARVVNLGSSFAVRGRPEASAYAASKAGLMAFTRCLAEELRETSVTANCIVPGATDTPLFRTTYPGEEGVSLAAERGLGAPDDLVGPLLFLCSPDADRITGTMLWLQAL